MANPTTNFGWVMPTSTDLVTDLPADFAVFGQGVDTTLADLKGGTTGQVLKKNSNTDMDFVWSADSAGMTNPMTTTGDTIYSSSGSTPARLGIGSSGQVLTVSGGVPTWATPSGGGTNWTLLNAGGTAMTGAATITVSSISGKDKILIFVQNASSASASSQIGIRFNGDTASNYDTYGFNATSASTYAAGNIQQIWANDTTIYASQMSGAASSIVSIGAMFSGCNASGIKAGTITGGGNTAGSNGNVQYAAHGFWSGSGTVTSVSVVSSSGNFDAGTLYVYASAN